MSKRPFDPTSLTRDDALNQLITSIAMEELGLSHILNAEGEKLQYVLGTLEGVTGPTDVTVDQVLQTNDSVIGLLEQAAANQTALNDQLSAALSTPTMQGPTGPTAAVIIAQLCTKKQMTYVAIALFAFANSCNLTNSL